MTLPSSTANPRCCLTSWTTTDHSPISFYVLILENIFLERFFWRAGNLFSLGFFPLNEFRPSEDEVAFRIPFLSTQYFTRGFFSVVLVSLVSTAASEHQQWRSPIFKFNFPQISRANSDSWSTVAYKRPLTKFLIESLLCPVVGLAFPVHISLNTPVSPIKHFLKWTFPQNGPLRSVPISQGIL